MTQTAGTEESVILVNETVEIDQAFGQYKDSKIALYGLGIETEKALKMLDAQYMVVGLLDSFRSGGELYGKRILSFDDAVGAGIQLIIVVARPGSCRAIAKGIGDQCRQKGIALMDIRGKDLLELKNVSYCFRDISGATRAELEEKIEHADVVSFDLFDTLVMRQTLFPEDVAEYVDCQLKEKGILISDFSKKRMESEKDLSRSAAPALVEIYWNLLETSVGKTGDITAEKLAEMEWNTDFDLLVPRKEVCDILKRTVESGKEVYIISDSYYSKNQLAKILEKCGIVEYTDILSSSDYKISKRQGLYKYLIFGEDSKRYLHIGDDIVADVENAERWGFETYRVYNGPDLLDEVGNLGLVEYMQSLSDRLRIGMFVSVIFNSPFQFEKEDKQIYIHNAYEIGYLICAPIISDFVFWFWQQMQENYFQNIWFGARDGYLIKKMYEYLTMMICDDGRTSYFLTSRVAAIRAGVRDENDIRYVDEMKFSGTLEENLHERFGIDISEREYGNERADEKGLLQFKNAILKKAQKSYENYQKYISKLKIVEGDIAFFDFVAKGTIQMYVQRLISNHLKGFYFLQLEKEYMKEKNLDIQAFYEGAETDSCVIYDNYYILESILTAPQPSVQEFDNAGDPVFADEMRSESDILCFKKVQEGIFDNFKTYIRLCPNMQRAINKKLDEVFLELIHKVKITDLDFLNLMVEDSFFNRMTSIEDVI